MGLGVETLALRGPLLLTPERREDARGWTAESFNDADIAEAVGRDIEFRQDVDVYSKAKGTLRGLHYQHPPFAQNKIVRVLRGAILDVLLDIRPASPSYGQHVKVRLDHTKGQQLWVPEGFAHGFVTLRDHTQVGMKVSAIRAPQAQGRIRWNDPLLFIDWEVEAPIVSENDARAPEFSDLARPLSTRL